MWARGARRGARPLCGLRGSACVLLPALHAHRRRVSAVSPQSQSPGPPSAYLRVALEPDMSRTMWVCSSETHGPTWRFGWRSAVVLCFLCCRVPPPCDAPQLPLPRTAVWADAHGQSCGCLPACGLLESLQVFTRKKPLGSGCAQRHGDNSYLESTVPVDRPGRLRPPRLHRLPRVCQVSLGLSCDFDSISLVILFGYRVFAD